MVSQFISSHDVRLLGDLGYPFPVGTHAIGRLDGNSEGLLLLTTNKKVTRLLFSAEEKHSRTYLVQVNNRLSEENLLRLQTGVSIRIKGGELYTTPACDVRLADNPELIARFENKDVYKFGNSTWLLITLTEGKFRQVRKMIAAVRHKCLRLIRVSIENISLDDLQPGEVLEMKEDDFFEKLNIKKG